MSETLSHVNEKKNRDRSMEMLRIFAMMGVIIMHYNNPGMGGGLFFCEGTPNVFIIYPAESLAICAVDLFMMISGYYLCCKDNRSIRKSVELLVQALLFGLGMYIVRIVLGQESFTVSGLFSIWEPLYYYIVLYLVVYWLSPYLNIALRELAGEKKRLRRMMLIVFLLLSAEPFLIEFLQVVLGRNLQGMSTIGLYGSQGGFTLITFFLSYIVGAYIRYELTDTKESDSPIIRYKGVVFAVSFLVILCGALLERHIAGSASASFMFNSPFVVMEAAALLTFAAVFGKKKSRFMQSDSKQGKCIGELAKASFTVYLFHIHFVTRIHAAEFAAGNSVMLILHLFGACIGIYLICFVVWFIYDKLSKPVFDMLFKMKIKKRSPFTK